VKGGENFFVNTAEAAVRHDGDYVSGAQFGNDVSDDLIGVGQGESRFALLRNSVN
jgi:hypothetical protein